MCPKTARRPSLDKVRELSYPSLVFPLWVLFSYHLVMVNEMRMQEDPQDVRNGNGGRRQGGGNGVGAVSGAAQPILDDDFALEGYAR